MTNLSVVKLRLALMGRPVRNYTFDKPIVTVGRDPQSDVFVDNPGISRDHFRLERTDAGDYQMVDLGSANGTLVNDQKVNTARLRNNDVVRFGKYTLWVGYDHDRRAHADDARRAGADAESHTMVLSRDELDSVIEAAKVKESLPQPMARAAIAGAVATAAALREPVKPAPAAAIIVAFVLGLMLGAGTVWVVLNR